MFDIPVRIPVVKHPLLRAAAVSTLVFALLTACGSGNQATSDRPTASPSTSSLNRNSCGFSIVREFIPGLWRCTFADDFNGGTLDASKWIVPLTSTSGYRSGDECYVDNAENVSVSGGHLNLTARREVAPFTCVSPFGNYTTQNTSGTVSTWGKFSQAYGRFEIRARFPDAKVAGLQSALSLYPQDLKYGAWPASGEIDIAETYSEYPDRVIPYLHYVQPAYDPTVTNTDCLIKDVSAFHTYAAVWSPTSITITYDGATCLVHKWNPAAPLKSPAPFDQPFIVFLTQALGIGDNAFDPATTPLPATTQIDYVHVWS